MLWRMQKPLCTQMLHTKAYKPSKFGGKVVVASRHSAAWQGLLHTAAYARNQQQLLNNSSQVKS
jgi:hypothetical protein